MHYDCDDVFRDTRFSTNCFKEVNGWCSNYQDTNYNRRRAVVDLICEGMVELENHLGDTNQQVTLNPLNEHRFIIFIDGPDNTGKTTLVNAILKEADGNAYGLAEFTSDPEAGVTNSEQFKAFSKFMTECQMPEVDAHITFANRHFNISKMLKDENAQDKLIVCDRSWLTAFAYQGQQSKELREEIYRMGLAFNKRLVDNGLIPIYILLTNDSYSEKGDEHLETLSEDSREFFDESVDRLVDDGILCVSNTSRQVKHMLRDFSNAHLPFTLFYEHTPFEEQPTILQRLIRKFIGI
ncbi:MAG: hypothetical protein ACRDCV_12465 [Plesiomonas shigelloides]